jgi:metal-responsive CopG/Arc/MetJ family transcriptional regulator
MSESLRAKQRVILEIDEDMMEMIDRLGNEMGIRSRGGVIYRILREILKGDSVEN